MNHCPACGKENITLWMRLSSAVSLRCPSCNSSLSPNKKYATVLCIGIGFLAALSSFLVTPLHQVFMVHLDSIVRMVTGVVGDGALFNIILYSLHMLFVSFPILLFLIIGVVAFSRAPLEKVDESQLMPTPLRIVVLVVAIILLSLGMYLIGSHFTP